MIHDILNILDVYGLLLLIGQFPQGSLGGLALTLLIAVAGLICSMPLALLVGVARTNVNGPAFAVASAFVYLVRGLPVLLLIFWAYFAVPLLTGQSVSGTTTVICALIVYEMAFLGEVIRSGIEALPSGQMQAARSLGLTYVQAMRDVILPQALYNVVPSMLSQFINLIKNTSLGYIIGVNELTYAAYQINGQLLTKPFQVFFILAVTYFVICFSLSRLVSFLERRTKVKRSGRVQENTAA
jgi:polar amino acid transport system permease protein